MGAQERIGAQGGAKASVLVQRRVSPLKRQPWSAWVVILLSWVALFVVLVLIFRATGCNRSSEARAPADHRVWAPSLNRWASRRDLGTALLQPVQERAIPAEIRRRAFEIRVERGGIHGRELDELAAGRKASYGKGTTRTLCSKTKLKEAENASKTKR